jgi:hypothetical protein
MKPQLVYWALAFLSCIWVGIDASKLGVRKGGLGGGPIDMSVTSWVICCFFLWIISFPCYLVARSKYQALRRRPHGYGVQPSLQQGWSPAFVTPEPSGASSTHGFSGAASAPPPISPDGQWYWDGLRWMPMAAPSSPPGGPY